ncbi:MAG TPA: LTA synthase family protein [Cyclobacteriaceae bacterium]|nr:LTA synthase family protein [Cyclobacteriaceae bacterium]HMV08478.1 LTA synthase family protein [Cyclobacteriaceae bacterium]HMV89189.1 LTA synthase family protein [Cyclobacteriaceae bacterium]HMX01251.1 LTA synthase family protein [Cyclobacteriaceae bacterium]HMX51335.1 LTA synthase family protein [Cyclobacteriaceae bacterium]
MKLASRFPRNRAGLFILFFVLAIGISTLLRIALLIKAWPELDSALSLPGIFFFGLLSDLLSTSYAAIPLALYLWLIPERFFKSRWNKYVLNSLFFVITFLLLFGAAAEWFFWDEFSGRFNFIAVDYLVYTTEVIGNITQSYPIGWLVFVITVLAIAGTYFLQPVISKASENYIPFKRRSILITAFAVVLYLFFLSFSNQYHRFSTNQYANELAGNGLYELFSAYRHNELNYDQFYSSVETRKAFSTLRDLLKTPEATFTSTDPLSLERNIKNTGPEKKLNVVLISVESFSADFMEHFGNKKHITPFLDSLAEHSLLFTNLYATGTRTVRGLEALSLCIPPTPGQSIVRRPDNEGLFSLGKVFQDKGYRSEYIYGGYGYFDNMNYFFSNNSYEVTDRTALKDSEIDYENIWGVADENLFTIATRNIDVHSQEKPVFAHIMTTSNHRPFTYPDGRIDIPSHTGRKGAVKYTDYAIGKFIREASKKPWFENTVFVIVADHCASSAGKTELPIEKYHIPMLIYSPSHVQPGVMSRLMSQIDIGPTLLGLLNFSYTSKFFGYDINKLEPGRERAFISTYQSLGYIKNNELIVLSPQFKTESFSFTASSDLHVTRDTTAVSEAIAWYQSASYAFRHGLLK